MKLHIQSPPVTTCKKIKWKRHVTNPLKAWHRQKTLGK